MSTTPNQMSLIRTSLILLGCVVLLPCHGAEPTRTELDAAIDQHRKGVLIVEAPAGAKVDLEQTGHHFWFGAALANSPFGGRMSAQDRATYLQVFLTNFNSAVTENALKWHDMEPRQGQVNYRTVDAILAWTDEHHIPLRGHNIFWGIPNRVQSWLKSMPDDEFEATLKKRALDVGRKYRGRFAEYDLNNEMIHGNYYEERLGAGITPKMAQWVREGDPDAVLYLNDYDILTGRRLDDYVKHIRELLEEKVPISGIGVQGHLHGESFDRSALHNALKKLSEFNLPIRITEFNLPGQRSKYLDDRSLKLTPAQEEAKAQDIVDYYRICFSYPRVTGILMWGFWEGANWIPASSMFARDWTPLPAAKAYHDLVYREWWTRAEVKTDAQGRCEIKAFYGKHRVKVGAREQIVELKPEEGKQAVKFD